MTAVEKKLDEPTGISTEELQDTATTLIIAGSETTATALTGIIYFILTNVEPYQKLIKEIRETFKTEEDITISSVLKLEYELAVIEESLRLFPPRKYNTNP
jgi:cytochrome P450